jgi:lipid-A-disaccharide synthase
VRIFFSTGEPSGELCAVALAEELRALRSEVIVEGIGGERMRRAGFRIVEETTGWATLGPIAAIGNIPRLWLAAQRAAQSLVAAPPDLIVLIDFGAFNVRFARHLRRCGYRRPIFYGFPPSAWLDREGVARAVGALDIQAVTPFAHQRDFYRSLDLPIQYFGHPIAATIPAREDLGRSEAGRFVFLPGSRRQEVIHHLPRMIKAVDRLRAALPRLEAVVVAANTQIEAELRRAVPHPLRVESDARRWLAWAEVACVASGTAVLEAALLGTPTVAIYALSWLTAMIARRVYRGKYVTVPNLVLGRMAIPELLQGGATPLAIAESMLALFRDPSSQAGMERELRTALESEGAMRRWAEYAMVLAEDSG